MLDTLIRHLAKFDFRDSALEDALAVTCLLFLPSGVAAEAYQVPERSLATTIASLIIRSARPPLILGSAAICDQDPRSKRFRCMICVF